MNQRYFIETDYFAALTEKALSEEQLKTFLKSCQDDCEEYKEHHKVGWFGQDGLPVRNRKPFWGMDYLILGLTIENRTSWEKTDVDKAIEHGGAVKTDTFVKIYPESVLKTIPPSDVIDKQANWSTRHEKEYEEEVIRDMSLLQKYLDRAEQIRKGGKQRAPRTKEVDLELAVDFHLIHGLTQEQAEEKAGIPQGALSKGRGSEILLERAKESQKRRTLEQDDDAHHPRVLRKELEQHFINEELGQGKKKN